MDESNRHAGILDLLTIAVLRLDEALCIGYCNATAETLLHISRRRVYGQALSDIPILATALLATAQRALEQGQVMTERALCLAQIEAAPCFDVSFIPGRDKRELVIELVPVDWHLQAAGTESHLKQQSALGQVFRSLAHEVRNPLGGLRGAAQLLQRELASPDLKAYTDVIIAEADRLDQLVQRFQRPAIEPNRHLINIHQVLERVRTLVEAAFAGRFTVRRDYDPSLPTIRADFDRLVQGLLNLAKNAKEAGADELILRTRMRRNLSLSPTLRGSAVVVEVCDNGSGVDPGLLDLIFYPLVSGRSQGTGLGLSTAQAIAIEHGGLIGCESQPGCTVFRWYFPMAEA